MWRSTRKMLDEAFATALVSFGFVRFHDELLSYVRVSPSEDCEQHIDIELRDDGTGFGITLQEACRDGTRRGELLEELAGLPLYACTLGDSASVGKAISLGLIHLRDMGIPWFLSKSFTTPAVLMREAVAARQNLGEYLAIAKERLRASQFEEAVLWFERASDCGELDGLSRRQFEYAKKKAASNR